MKLIKLGKKPSKGLKSFSLVRKNTYGYTIKCTGRTRIYTFNNVNILEWLYEGTQVYMASEHHHYQTAAYNLDMWEKVEITLADKIKYSLLDIEKIK